MTIRPMIPEDHAEWLRMRQALWPDCSEERHRMEAAEWGSAKGCGVVFVAHEAGKSLQGFLEVSIRRDHVDGTSSTPVPYIEGWYVDQGFRGRGLGRQLLVAAEEWARTQGFTEIASDAELNNPESVRAHLSCHFAEVGRSVHFIKQLP